MKLKYFVVGMYVICTFFYSVFGQTGLQKGPQLKINFSEDGKEFIKITFLNQTWVRYTDANPGTTVNGYLSENIFDIGLRRTRLQLFGQISPRVFFYTQFGMNNFTSNSKQYQGAFFHDAVTEFTVHEKWLSIGSGLTGWSGLSRYASPSVGSILSTDAPLYQQTTNGATDQFLRKLSLYAKGKIGKLDYRMALSKPMATQNAVISINAISTGSEFSPLPAKLQTQGYFMYQFFDQEENKTPYTTGTYLGKKKIFNLGAGFIYQPDAMWNLNSTGDTLFSDMMLVGFDLFADVPIHKDKGNAFTAYLALNHFDLGNNYIRNVGVMNPANGVNTGSSFNGSGNGFPMIGTGLTGYIQVGYLLKKELIGNGTIQFYMASQISDFTKLSNTVMMYEGGLNWLVKGDHQSKISLNCQLRPVFNTSLAYSHHRTMVQMQYQISL